MPDKSASARGIQTDFLNYQLVVIKAFCIYFTPCTLYLQTGAKTVRLDVKLQLPLGFSRGSELQGCLPIHDPGPRLLGRRKKNITPPPLQIIYGTLLWQLWEERQSIFSSGCVINSIHVRVSVSKHLVVLLRCAILISGATMCLDLTRPWLNEGLFCSAEPQDPEPLRSSIAENKKNVTVRTGRTKNQVTQTGNEKK